MIIPLTPKKDYLKVIPTEANKVSEVEESIEITKISRLRPGQLGLRSK